MFTQKPTDVPLAKQYVMVCRQSGSKIPSVPNQSTRDRQIINFPLQLPYPLATGWQAELAEQPMSAKEKSLHLLQIKHSHAYCRQSFIQDCYPAVHNSDVMQIKKKPLVVRLWTKLKLSIETKNSTANCTECTRNIKTKYHSGCD